MARRAQDWRFRVENSVTLTVVDDVKLGLLPHRGGKRTRAFIGGDDTEYNWGRTVRDSIKIMEKNFFAVIDYRTGLVLGIVVAALLLWGTALAGLLNGSPAGLAAGLAPLSIILPAQAVVRRLGGSSRGALPTPFISKAEIHFTEGSKGNEGTRLSVRNGPRGKSSGRETPTRSCFVHFVSLCKSASVFGFIYPVLAYAVVNSAVVTLRQGGVRWRDTFLSLDQLRAGNVQ